MLVYLTSTLVSDGSNRKCAFRVVAFFMCVLILQLYSMVTVRQMNYLVYLIQHEGLLSTLCRRLSVIKLHIIRKEVKNPTKAVFLLMVSLCFYLSICYVINIYIISILKCVNINENGHIFTN